MSPSVAWNWRASVGGGGTSRCWGGWRGSGERSAAAANSASVSTQSQHSSAVLTVQATCRAQNGLDDANDALQALPDVGIFGLNSLLLAQHDLEVMIRLLALEVPNALIQTVDLCFCALSDCALSLAIIRALPCELLGSEICDATRGGRAAFLRSRLAHFSLAVVLFRSRRGRIGFARRKSRHSDWGSALQH